jgi:hypothetical protein
MITLSIQIKIWKWTWIGHTLRKGNEAIEREALDWNPQGKRRKGKSWSEVKRMDGDRIRW